MADRSGPPAESPTTQDDPVGEVVLAVDLGGTKTAAALVGRQGRTGPVAQIATPAGAGPAAVVAAIVELAAELVGEGESGARVRGVGIGTAGVVDVESGRIVSSTETFADWAGLALRDRLGDALASWCGRRIPVHVQNDVDAHAEGEIRYGAAAGWESALVVAVGTGVGAGVVLDRAVRRGSHHVAGEIGHLPVAGADHLTCPCGRRGHLEALGSGTGLYRHYVSLGGDPQAGDARGVIRRAEDGDELARSAVVDSAAAVGRAVAAVVTVLDPTGVVLSGGMARAGPLWWDAMEAAARAELIDVLASVPVVAGALADAAPLLGAAASAWELVDARAGEAVR